jgi:thiol-disulfide isomerase/thioredoxin
MEIKPFMGIKSLDMKNILLLLTLGAPILLSACKSQGPAQKGYVLKGALKGVETGAVKVIEYNEDDRTSKVIDSGAIAAGSFALTGSVGTPKMVSVQIEPGNWSFPVFLEDTVLRIAADTAGAEYFDYTKYGGRTGANIKNYTETGSRNFNDWMQYEHNPGQQQYTPVFAVLSAKLKATKDIDAQYKVRDEMDSVGQLQRAWEKKQIDAYVQSNPSSVAGVYMFDQFYLFSQQMPAGELDSMLARFEGPAKVSVYYARLERELTKKKALEPGQTAPDFTLRKRDSTTFALSSLRGAYTMIDFWASWCHPCRQAIPHWKEVYQKYHAKGFEILSVSDDYRWSDWKKAMDQEKMPWTQVCDEFPVKNMPARVGTLYMTTFIPFYVLLDKEGKILEYTGDETKIDARLAALLGH